MPTEILNACLLMAAIAMLSLVFYAFEYQKPTIQGLEDRSKVISYALQSALPFVLLIWPVWLGHNWARWIFATLVVFTHFGLFSGRMKFTPRVVTIGLISEVLELWVIYLLFLSEGVRWFEPSQL